MFEWIDGRDVPTALKPGDVIQYNHKYQLAKFCREMSALHITLRDDKHPLELIGFDDFVSYCRLIAHVCNLGVSKMYAKKQPGGIWRCKLGTCRDSRVMPLRRGDVIRFEPDSLSLEIIRNNDVLYVSNGVWLDISNFCFLSTILASCCGQYIGQVDIQTNEREQWSFVLHSSPV